MNKVFIIIMLIMLPFKSEAQIIKSKLDLSVGYGIGKFIGDDLVSDNGFIFPSLYCNYENMTTILIRGLIWKDNYVNLGASFNYYGASEWHLDGYSDYESSSAGVYSFSPLIQIHNKSAGYGFLNRTVFYLEAAPALGLSTVTIPYPLFEVENQGSHVNPYTEERGFLYGLRCAAGVSFSVNQFTGLFLESGGGYYLITPALYADRSFINYYISGGVKINLVKDKRFYY